VPMGLGFAVAYCLMPTASYAACLFVAATLSATSIGITARVLAQVGQLQTREAKTILGAATIDDVLGLILLSVVSSIVITGHIDALGIAHIAGFALLFFIGIFTLGPLVLKAVIPRLSFLELWEAKLFLSFIFLMLLAYAATLVQMAAIIGAFAAGVVLHDAYFKQEHFDEKNKQSTIEELVAPLESILAPIFFMMIGVQVKIETFFNVHVLILAVGLIVAAIIGKLFSGFGANRNDDRLLVGIGMMPRGEVGLVFASIGSTIGVISDDLFSAIVLMVVVTTFIAPILLKARLTTHPPL
jgi:Kef-type K+ transport system membrane component KefB